MIVYWKSDGNKKIAFKSYHEEFLKTEYACNRISLSLLDTVMVYYA